MCNLNLPLKLRCCWVWLGHWVISYFDTENFTYSLSHIHSFGFAIISGGFFEKLTIQNRPSPQLFSHELANSVLLLKLPHSLLPIISDSELVRLVQYVDVWRIVHERLEASFNLWRLGVFLFFTY